MSVQTVIETDQIHHFPVRISYSHPSHSQPLVATSAVDVPVFVHAETDGGAITWDDGPSDSLRGSVSLKDILKVICRASPEIIPSTQIQDGSVYVPDCDKRLERETIASTRRLSHLARPCLPMLSSDGMTPSLVASSEPNFSYPSSSYGEQTRTGFFIPSTPMDQSSMFLSSPAIASSSFGNPFQSSPASSSRFTRRKTRSTFAGSSISSMTGAKAWTGKGTLYNVLTEAGQGKTIIKCRVVRSTEFAPKSADPRSTRRNYDENDGLAALAMQEGGSADSDIELDGDRQHPVSDSGWGCVVEIRLRNLAQPITLDQTARLRSAVFGERPRPAMYRRVEAVSARQQEVSERERTGRETRRSRLMTDRIGSTGSLARKTPGQMADAMLPSDAANRSSLGFSSLGLDGSDLVELDGEDEADIKRNRKRASLTRPAQRYPAALSASSSLKRKSLIIPHDQIPLNRRGPNLAAEKKRRRLNREDEAVFAARTVRDTSPSEPEIRPIRSLEIPAILELEQRNSYTPGPPNNHILDNPRSESSTPVTQGLPPDISFTRQESQEIPDVKPVLDLMSRRPITLRSLPSVPSNPPRHPIRQGLKRTLSEIAERESEKHAEQDDDQDDLCASMAYPHSLLDSARANITGRTLLQSGKPSSTLRQKDSPNTSLGYAETRRDHISVSTHDTKCPTQSMIALPLSDDSSSLEGNIGQLRDLSAPPAADWLEAPGLECLFDLGKQAQPAAHIETMTETLDIWELGASTATINTQLDAGYTFNDDAFSFFDLSYGGGHDINGHLKQSPFDFSQLPPSSPPQSECNFQHSVLLLSSPEDSSTE